MLSTLAKTYSLRSYRKCLYVPILWRCLDCNTYKHLILLTLPVHKMKTLNINLNFSLRNFYRIAYDDDDICESYINEDATFGGLLENITEPYDYIFKNGEEDSIIRERLFEKLADIMGVEYNDIYNLWLAN